MVELQNAALVVHPGTQHAPSLAAQLQRRGMLGRYWTGFAIRDEGLMGRVVGALSDSLRGRLSGRVVRGLPASKLRLRFLAEVRALAQLRGGVNPQLVMRARNAAFQLSVPHLELEKCEVVIGFDTSAWLLGKRAKEQGKRFILDQTTTHSRSKESRLALAREQYPEWVEDLISRERSVALEEEREHELADLIVVASSYARSTMVDGGVPARKIVVNPYGVDLDRFRPAEQRRSDRALRFLFVGSVNARKGAPLLFEAWRELDPTGAELVIAGDAPRQVERLLGTHRGIRFLGRVSKDQIPSLMRSCDILVLPSYFEGFGMVLLEALASGLPIIASDTSAAPDLLSSAQAGVVFRSGEVGGLRDAINRLQTAPEQVREMGTEARRVAERYSWDAYGDRWAALLEGER
jgi:starch synthase